MREILFRAKRVDNGEWETGSLVVERMGTSDERVFIADKMTVYHTPVIPETVGQYTGLCDRNGKKIFEGDILKSPCWHIYDFPCVCIYAEEHQTESIQGFGLYHKINDWVELVCSDEWDEFEVIGNVIDNPELLEE